MTEIDEPGAILPSGRREWLWVLGFLLLALVVRMAVVVWIHDDYVPLNDATNFDHMASALVDGQGFGETQLPLSEGPSAFRAPAYPFFLASVYAIAGPHSWTAGLLANALMGVIAVAMIALVASQLFGRKVGMMALAVASVHPTLVLFGSSLQLEPLLIVCAMGALAAGLEHRRRPRGWRWPVVAGVFVGLSILCREIGFMLVLPVAFLLWTRRPRLSRAALLTPIASVVVAAAVVIPWTIRNAVQMDAFVPVSSSSGLGIAGSYNQTSYSYKPEPALWLGALADPEIYEKFQALPKKTEIAVDEMTRKHAIDFALDHPAYVPKVVFWSTVRLFDLRGTEDALFIAQYVPYQPRLVRLAVHASWALGILALVALMLPVVNRVPKPVWWIPVLSTLSLVVIAGNIRYRAMIEPFTIILASVTLALLLDWMRSGSQPTPAAPTEEV